MSSLKKNIISGILWTIGGQIIYLLIVFATNIWLARILSPHEFGQVGIIMFFITLLGIFTESGLGGALVRKKEATFNDYSTVFVTNLILSIFLFFILFFVSRYISNFYNDNKLKDLLIVSGTVLIINAFQITQNAKIASELKFKQKSIFKFISIMIGSTIGIILSYNGMGVWSLVYMQIITSLSLTIIYWLYQGVFFSLRFEKQSFKELYSFGINTTLASFLNTFFDNIYQLILGRYFSITQVGFYYQAKRLQDVPGNIINSISQGVVFSSLAKLQDDKPAFIQVYNKIALLFLVFLGFITCFIYLYSKPIILILYGEKWMGAVFYMQLLVIASFFYYQELVNRVIFKVFNRTKQILYLEFLKKIIQCIGIIIGLIYLDIEVLLIGFIITSFVSYLVNYYFSRKIIININWYELINLTKILIISIFSIFIVTQINSIFTGFHILWTIPALFLIYFYGQYILKICNPIAIFKGLLVSIIKIK